MWETEGDWIRVIGHLEAALDRLRTAQGSLSAVLDGTDWPSMAGAAFRARVMDGAQEVQRVSWAVAEQRNEAELLRTVASVMGGVPGGAPR